MKVDVTGVLRIQVELQSDVSMPDSLPGYTETAACFWCLQVKKPPFIVLRK